MWMKHPLVQRVVGRNRMLRRSAIGLLSAIETVAMRGHKRREAMTLIRGSRRGRESLLTANEHFTLYGIASAQAALAGDMAEFGVFEGSSATVLATAAPHRTLHLFDTFEGLPEPRADERRVLRRGQFVTDLDRVRRRLAAHDNLAFHVGAFPRSARGLGAFASASSISTSTSTTARWRGSPISIRAWCRAGSSSATTSRCCPASSAPSPTF